MGISSVRFRLVPLKFFKINFDNMKKILNFVGLCVWLLGTIGGFGYCAWIGQWHIAIAILVLGGLAFPTVKKMFNNLVN